MLLGFYNWPRNFCLRNICLVSAALIGGNFTMAVAQDYPNNGQADSSSSFYNSGQTQQTDPNQQTGQTQITPVQLTVDQQSAMEAAQREAFAEQTAAAEAAAIATPQQPFADLTAEEADYLNQFLDYWESSSQKVKQYVCEFRRFEYDSEIVNYRDPATNRLAAATIAIGSIRYADPDKGFYETDQIWNFDAPPPQPGAEAVYKEAKAEDTGMSWKEKWICDGRNIYEFDFETKVLYEAAIPTEMQGERIIDSPLPFLFGAKKDQILERYWVRVVQQPDESQYWLEAYPKRIEDARLYSKIEVHLAREDFLPQAMHVYSPQYNPEKGNFQSRYFAFENRQINGRLNAIKDFFNIFVRPQTPIGWRRTERSDMQDDQRAELPTQIK